MYEGNDECFLDELDILVNRIFIFKIEVSAYNTQRGNKTYTVQKMSDNIKLIQQFQNSTDVSQVKLISLCISHILQTIHS